MSQVTAFLPTGLSMNQKAEFHKEVKEVFCNRLNFKPQFSSIFINELRSEHGGNSLDDEIFIVISTTAGKPEEIKEQITKDIDGICRNLLGEKCKKTFVLYEEHPANCVCGDGTLFSIKINL